METTVALQDKKDFIRWFLKNYQLKRRECVWILNFMLNHENLLKRVMFVRESRYCSRGLVMSTTCTKDEPFIFYKGDSIINDAEKAFHSLRLEEDNFYLQLNFSDSNKSSNYMSVLEENPFAPLEKTVENPEIKKEALKLLTETMAIGNKMRITKVIDEILDLGQKEKFLELSHSLKEFEEILESVPFSQIEKIDDLSEKTEVIVKVETKEEYQTRRNLQKKNKDKIIELIDRALDEKDKEKFNELSAILKTL
jgi:uncharacterized protein YpiB (UPF0302 family)